MSESLDPATDLEEACHWVFAYGSLIYKIDFPIEAKEQATLHGWERRFWQGSHDHRGTPEAPGRVLTLIATPNAHCGGVALRVRGSVFTHLDFREKNGYERHELPITLKNSEETVSATVYIAAPDNPAYLGNGTNAELAAHIARSVGPSGKNADYLIDLASALEELGIADRHVQQLAQEVRALL
ncbi:MAG: gamma-glutamylcyclotransferase [Pseudomonadota bacterium]